SSGSVPSKPATQRARIRAKCPISGIMTWRLLAHSRCRLAQKRARDTKSRARSLHLKTSFVERPGNTTTPGCDSELVGKVRRILDFKGRIAHELLLAPVVEVFAQLEVDLDGHIHACLGQRLPQQPLGLAGEGERVTRDPQRFGRIVETDRVLGA